MAIRKKYNYLWDSPKGTAGIPQELFNVQGRENFSITYQYENNDNEICTISYTVDTKSKNCSSKNCSSKIVVGEL